MLGKAHGCDAVGADHQQGDDDVDKGQPVGKIGPVDRGLRQPSEFPPCLPLDMADFPGLSDHPSSAFPTETQKLHLQVSLFKTPDGMWMKISITLTTANCQGWLCSSLPFSSASISWNSPGPCTHFTSPGRLRPPLTPATPPPHLSFLTLYNSESDVYRITLLIIL